jgi:hypothetical protein
MAEMLLYGQDLNGAGLSKEKGLRFNSFATLALAEADQSMVAQGNRATVGNLIYWRAELGQPLVPLIGQGDLTTQLNALSTTLENKIAQSNAFAPFNASTATGLPTGPSIKAGKGFNVTVSGTVAGQEFKAGDIFFSLIDNPQSLVDFGDIVPIASIASVGVSGVVKIAEVLADYTNSTDSKMAVSVPVLKSLLASVNSSIQTLTAAITAAQTTADLAVTKADTADVKATNAQTSANTADAKAVAADTKATAADIKAVAAQTSANTANTAAEAADTKAVAAQTSANTANTAAAAADTKAVAAQTSATAADTKATAAQLAATTTKAVSFFDKANPIVERSEFDSLQDTEPIYLLDSGGGVFPKAGGSIKVNRDIVTALPIKLGTNMDFDGNDLTMTQNGTMFTDSTLPATYPTNNVQIVGIKTLKAAFNGSTNAALFDLDKVGAKYIVKADAIVSTGPRITDFDSDNELIIEAQEINTTYTKWDAIFAAWSGRVDVRSKKISNNGHAIVEVSGNPTTKATIVLRDAVIDAKANPAFGWGPILGFVNDRGELIIENSSITMESLTALIVGHQYNNTARLATLAGSIVRFRGSCKIICTGTIPPIMGIQVPQTSVTEQCNHQAIKLMKGTTLINEGILEILAAPTALYSIGSPYEWFVAGTKEIIPTTEVGGTVINKGTMFINKPLQSGRINVQVPGNIYYV